MQRRTELLQFSCLLGILGFIMMLGSCREPFYPRIPDSELNLLVVEGFINSGTGSTSIQLSRSANVYGSTLLKPETGAIVRVEGEDKSSIVLNGSSGNYTAMSLNLRPQVRYRLHINCVSQEEYVSSYTLPVVSPPVDSIQWTRDAGGVHLFVNTHDPANKTHFYRFITEETWEINSAFFDYDVYVAPLVKYIPADVVPKLYYCWQYAYPSDIKIASSTSLSRDVISQFPVKVIPPGNIRLGVRYSLLVREHAESASSYEFYQLLKKNSELTGSIFSSQPSQINGNIQTLKGGKVAIGYINVGVETQKRIFINYNQVPGWNYSVNCPVKAVPLDSIKFYFATLVPILDITSPGGTLIGYQSSYPDCADCRFRGSPVKPSYW